MANRRRRTAPKRALIGPLLMLASGMVVGVMMWRFLMLEPPSPDRERRGNPEQLSHQDRRALDDILSQRP